MTCAPSRSSVGRLLAVLALTAACGCNRPSPPDGGLDVNCSPFDGLLAGARPMAAPLDELVFPRELLAGRTDLPSVGGQYQILTVVETRARFATQETRDTRAGDLGRYVEITPRGEFAIHVAEPGRPDVYTSWPGETLARVPRFPPSVPREYGDEWLVWSDVTAGRELIALDLEAAYPTSIECPGHFDPGAALRVWNDELLWMLRQPRCEVDDPDYVYLHLFGRDGTERLESVRQVHPVDSPFASENTIDVGLDGSLWYLAHWTPPPTDPDPRWGVRAVRIDQTGAIAAMSPLLVVSSDVGTLSNGRVYVRAHWGRVAADGAYLLHFAASPEPSTTPTLRWQSYVARVEPDGTLAWRWVSPEPIGAFSPQTLREPSIALDGEGGVVMAVTNQWNSDFIAVFRIRRDGSTPDGTMGTAVIDGIDPDSLETISIDSDGAAGFFVGWVELPQPTQLQHWDASLTASWAEPVRFASVYADADEGLETTVRSDGIGGAWVMTTRFIEYSNLQHVDSTGRPLFWNYSGFIACRHRPTWFAWPDPDEPPTFYDDGPLYTPDAITTFSRDAGTSPDAGAVSDGGFEFDAGVTTMDADVDVSDAGAGVDGSSDPFDAGVDGG